MFLLDLISLIQSATLGTYGQDLFVFRLPDNIYTAIALRATGGTAPTYDLTAIPYSTERPGVQILGRSLPGAVPEQAMFARLEAIHQLFAGTMGTVINGTKYHSIHPLQSPFLLGPDEKGRALFAFNALVEKEPS